MKNDKRSRAVRNRRRTSDSLVMAEENWRTSVWIRLNKRGCDKLLITFKNSRWAFLRSSSFILHTFTRHEWWRSLRKQLHEISCVSGARECTTSVTDRCLRDAKWGSELHYGKLSIVALVALMLIIPFLICLWWAPNFEKVQNCSALKPPLWLIF